MYIDNRITILITTGSYAIKFPSKGTFVFDINLKTDICMQNQHEI